MSDSHEIVRMQLPELLEYFYDRYPPTSLQQSVEALRAHRQIARIVGRRSEKDATVHEANAVLDQQTAEDLKAYYHNFLATARGPVVVVPTDTLQ